MFSKFLIVITESIVALFCENQGRRLTATTMEIVQDEIVLNKTVEKKVIYTVQIGCGYKMPQNDSKPTRCVSCSKNFFVKITEYGRHEGMY